MIGLINYSYSVLSGACNFIAGLFRRNRVQAVATHAFENIEEKRAIDKALLLIQPALESCRSWARLFYAILGRETPAMEKLGRSLEAIELPPLKPFLSNNSPANKPREYVEDKRTYVAKLETSLSTLRESGLTEDYMRELSQLPQGSLARRKYDAIAECLTKLQRLIDCNQTGTLTEEVLQFGETVRPSAVRALMYDYHEQSVDQEMKKQQAFDLAKAYIKSQEGPALNRELEVLDSYNADSQKLVYHLLIRLTANRVSSSDVKEQNVSIKNIYRAIFGF